MNKFILFFWDYFPPSRNLIRKCLYSTADTINNLGERVGQMYNDLFSRIGTSWYDHSFDHLRGISNYHWMERVFFTLDKIKKEDEVLDIGCGDGSFDSLFYADKARSIVAIDKDPKAISYAKKHYQRSNVKYITCDITKMKNTNNRYDIILMFAVIEHFTKSEGTLLLKNIKKSLKQGGIFFGSTPILNIKGMSNWEHQNEFASIQDLRSFLLKEFNTVRIKESQWTEGRRECYFECKV
jgi:2-polyprenyl-3-methyl-5-hydroxy-6-metoxy-1,4-benzoquinol methylase